MLFRSAATAPEAPPAASGPESRTVLVANRAESAPLLPGASLRSAEEPGEARPGTNPGPAFQATGGAPADRESTIAPADDGLVLQLSLGLLFLMFSVSEALLPQSGLPAAVSAGIVLGLRRGPAVRSLDIPIRQLAMLAITVLFPLLAADLGWSDLLQLGWGGLACVLALLLIRWLVVQIAGLGLSALDWRRKLILSWIAPRGIVTAAVASLFALELDQAGETGGAAMKGLVFLTILFTVSVQGFTAPWLARWLGLVELPPEIAAGNAESALPEL